MLSCATKKMSALCCGDGGSKDFRDSGSDAICGKYLRLDGLDSLQVDGLDSPWADVSRMWLWSVIPSKKLMRMKPKLRALQEK
jgi:hypothetical protein